MTESTKQSEKETPSSWVSVLMEMALRHAREIVGGAVAVAGLLEKDARAFVMKFVGRMVLGIALLFVGIGFAVFGVGMLLVEVLRLGPSAGSMVVGMFFIVVGMLVFSLSRR